MNKENGKRLEYDARYRYLMYVGKYRDLFVKTRNPLYAWRAFSNARRFNFEIPEEILDYLLTVGKSIENIAADPPEAKQRPFALAKALQLHKTGAGQGSPFTEYSKRLEARYIALAVVQSAYYGPDLLDYAFDDVSEKTGLSKATVRRIFLAHRKQWEQAAQKLIDAGAITYGENGEPRMAAIGTADDMRESAEILKAIERIQEPTV